ncbi:hypothetical protein GOODEAATRI_024803 [Goodea atripinnis]|uniref:Uncharacterized protein n=1 Tax=Goodea atripinnis TaxID=208336 RepID=A0ABV0P7J9_9TELE
MWLIMRCAFLWISLHPPGGAFAESEKNKTGGTLSNTDIETEKVCDEALLRLFNSDTEEDDFSGFIGRRTMNKPINNFSELFDQHFHFYATGTIRKLISSVMFS